MPHPHLPPAPCGLLPAALRVLSVTGAGSGCWSDEALAEDSAVDITLRHAAGDASSLKMLRQEPFDAVIITHDPPALDAFKLLDAIIAGHGDDLPLLVAGHASELELAAMCYEAGADAYLCFAHTSTRAFFWQLARAVERRRLIAANRQHEQASRNRLASENDEADRLLTQQRQLIDGLEAVSDSGGFNLPVADADAHSAVHQSVQQQYHQLLQCSVVAGSDHLQPDIHQLAAHLAATGATAAEAMNIHLQVLEQMLEGLGPRSARHVITCGDRLILELMTNLAAAYRGLSHHSTSGLRAS